MTLGICLTHYRYCEGISYCCLVSVLGLIYKKYEGTVTRGLAGTVREISRYCQACYLLVL